MAIFGGDAQHSDIESLQRSEELGEAELRQRPGAAELEDVGH
jgi:hypothetical protein